MSHVDLEQGGNLRSVTGSDVGSDDNVSLPDADDVSCYFQFYSDCPKTSSVSDSSVDAKVDIETGVPEIKVHLDKVKRDCRICHMGLESNSHEYGAPIELGCSCKDDLAAAHNNCAEAWFKIRGNKTCEICHSIARNVAGQVSEIGSMEQSNEPNNATEFVAVAAPPPTESRNFWQGHRFLNFLLQVWYLHFLYHGSSTSMYHRIKNLNEFL